MYGILQDQERISLRDDVSNQLLENGPIRLKRMIPPVHVTRIDTDANLDEYAHNVIRYCEFSAWSESPALIVSLMSFTLWKIKGTYDNAINRINSAIPPIYHQGSTVWNTCLVPMELPFLGREKTRKAIECFSYPLIVGGVKPPGVRVLVVNGSAKAGKTFTYNYIIYVNKVFANLNFTTLFVDFKKQVASRFGPLELIKSLLDQVNPQWEEEVVLPILDNQQPARWMRELVGMLVEQLINKNIQNGVNTNWFLVLDRFDDPTVPRETLDLIQILSAVATGAEFAAESNNLIRLVLLGYQEIFLIIVTGW